MCAYDDEEICRLSINLADSYTRLTGHAYLRRAVAMVAMDARDMDVINEYVRAFADRRDKQSQQLKFLGEAALVFARLCGRGTDLAPHIIKTLSSNSEAAKMGVDAREFPIFKMTVSSFDLQLRGLAVCVRDLYTAIKEMGGNPNSAVIEPLLASVLGPAT